MIIREARDADMPHVQRIIKSVYDEYGWGWDPAGYHADLYALDAHYHDLGDPFFLAEIDGLPVGTIALEDHRGKLTQVNGLVRILGCDGSAERLYVHPDARRQGVGSRLFDHILDLARERGMQRLEIWSDESLVDAHRLYESRGAYRVGRRLCDDEIESPEFGFVLPL